MCIFDWVGYILIWLIIIYLQSDLHSFQQQLVYQWVLHKDNCRRQTVLSAVNLISLSSEQFDQFKFRTCYYSLPQ